MPGPRWKLEGWKRAAGICVARHPVSLAHRVPDTYTSLAPPLQERLQPRRDLPTALPNHMTISSLASW